MPDLQGRIAELSRGGGGGHRRRRPMPPSWRRLRVRYLGRKAELTGILRGIAELPADRAGAGRHGGQRGAAGARGAELERAQRRARGAASSSARLAAEAIDVTLPGAPPSPVGARNLLIRTQREIEDVFVGLGYRVMEGPEVELDYYNFTALNHPPGHPARMAQDTFYVDPATLRRATVPIRSERRPRCRPAPRTSCCAPTPRRCRCARWRPSRRRSSSSCPGRCYRCDPFDATHSPIFHQVEGLAVGEAITLADLKGTLDEFARGDLRPRARDPLPAGLLPVHRAERRGRRLLLPLRWLRRAAGRLARPALQGHGWIEILGSGMVDPNVFGFVREQRLRPGAGPGLRVRHGDRADRDAQARRPRPAQVLRERRARPGAVPMRVPYSWLPSTATRASPSRSSPTRSRCTRSRSSGSITSARRRAEGFVVGRVLCGRAAPQRRPAAGLRGRRRRRRRGRSSAVRPTSPPARPCRWRCPAPRMPGGEKLGRRSCAASSPTG